MSELKTLIQGLGFPEGPRWREGGLWFSDMGNNLIVKVNIEGEIEKTIQVPGTPSGLGWLPDGRLLIVLMEEKRIMAFGDNKITDYADLSQLASHHCNDMVVSRNGRAYVGNFGYAAFDGGEAKTAELIMVDNDASPKVVANELAFPNGVVIDEDNRTLVVAESLAARLTAFSINDKGDLYDRRVWAEFDQLGFQDDIDWGRILPDGITMDSEGGIWIASPAGEGGVLRVLEGGEITARVDAKMRCYACMLGGEEGKTLFILGTEEEDGNEPVGLIKMLDVGVSKRGLP
jgi:sugar lactone lactonase YvrE